MCNDELKAVVTMALQTGMRQGEILRLRWSDVDLSNRYIRLSDSKNGTRRDIPMCEGLHQVLVEKKAKATGVYVFSHDNDQRHTTRMRSAWKRSSARVGLGDVRFHDLRHTFASHLVMNGANLFAVQTLMGHKSLEMTRRYSHLAPGVLRNAVLTMDAIMGTGTEGAVNGDFGGKIGAKP